MNSVLPVTVKLPFTVPPLKGRYSFVLILSISVFCSVILVSRLLSAAATAISLLTITSLSDTGVLPESGYTILTSLLNVVSPFTVPPLVVERYFLSNNLSDENSTISGLVFLRKIFSPPSAMLTANSPSTRTSEDGILPATVLFLREIWSTFFAIKNEILL